MEDGWDFLYQSLGWEPKTKRFSMEMREQELPGWLQISKMNSWERDQQLSIAVLSYIDKKSGTEGQYSLVTTTRKVCISQS